MKANEQDVKSLRKTVNSLLREMRPEIKKIGGVYQGHYERDSEGKRIHIKGDKTLPIDAYQHFKELEKDIKLNPTSKLNESELLSRYRQLEYIKSLKSSTLQGAYYSRSKFGSIKEHLEALSESQRREFWLTFGKARQIYKGMDKFKYEILDYIDSIFGQDDQESIIETIQSVYDDLVKGTKANENTKTFRVQFSKKLRDKLQ